MIARHKKSLKVRLTRRLVLWQILTLIAIGFIASTPLSRLAQGAGLDDIVIKMIAESVDRDGEEMVLDPGAGLSRIQAQYPDFWFHAQADDGTSITNGKVPEGIEPALENLRYISFGDFGSPDVPEVDAVIVRQANSDAGWLHIATGGGPLISGLSWKFFLLNRHFVGFSALLSLVMIIAIAFTLRRELQPLDAVAEEAAQVDVDQPGIRLSTESVPLEMQPLVAAFNDALDRIDEGIEKRHRFMADAAHELRTPIAILQTRVDLLNASPERDRLMLDVARLSNLADQLLDLQRIDIGQSRIETIDLVALAEAVTGEMAPLVIGSGDEISFDSDADRVLVKADKVALARALTNLIQNAIAHAGERAKIMVSVSMDGTLTVGDSGPGIAPEQRMRVFEPFYRVKPSTRGAGLGLNLVQEIVLRHKGTIRVGQSRLGGAAFIIGLPLVAPFAAAAQ